MIENLAKRLRQCTELPEYLLWQELKKLTNCQFQRLQPLENYIVDFICLSSNIIIEIEGDTHDLKYQQGEIRLKQLQTAGFEVLFFSNTTLKENLGTVIQSIQKRLLENRFIKSS